MNSSIPKAIENLKIAQNAVLERRILWQQQTKALIFEKLKKINNDYDLRWNISSNEIWENAQYIYITQDKVPSGIIKIKDNGFTALVKHCGALMFSQIHNGKILIWIDGPWIEEKTIKAPAFDLILTEPSSITEDFIEDYFERFIIEMAAWENSGQKDRILIGFNREGA